MFYPREILLRLEKELKTNQIVVITGMRQVGKTTLLKYLFSKIDSLNKVLLDFENPLHRKIFEEENFDNIWNNLLSFGITNQKRAFIFLDEIQNLPSSSQAIKYLFDHWPVKFFLTGSSSFYLKNLFPESLAGRKLIFELFPLTFEEFLVFKGIERPSQKNFSLKANSKNKINYQRWIKYYQEFMDFGGFPAVVLETDPERKKLLLEEIFKSYFEKDVRSLADFKETAKLRDLILLLVSRVGSKIDITKLASELAVSRETIYSYLSFLAQTYFIALLPKFSRSFDRQVAGGKKLFFGDTGLANLLGKISLGQIFENSIFQNLRPNFSQIHFFSRRQTEIDFIVEGKIGLEVKVSVSRSEINRLRQKCQTLGIKESYLVSFNWNGEKGVLVVTDF